MATWTTLPDASLEPGKPIRSIDGLALRDNPIAISEGAVGAPRIIGRAAKRLADYPVLTVTAADTYSAEFGSNLELFLSSTASPSYVVAARYTIAKYTGAIRFKASHAVNEAGFGYLAFYKNNIQIAVYNTFFDLTDTYVQRTIDSSVSPGDVFEWRIAASSGNLSLFKVNSITASNGYTTRPLYIDQLNVNTA